MVEKQRRLSLMEVLFVGQRKIQTVVVSSAFILALQKIRYHHSLTSECQRRKGTMTSRHYGILIPVYFLGTNVRWGKGKSWEEESKNEQQNSLCTEACRKQLYQCPCMICQWLDIAFAQFTTIA